MKSDECLELAFLGAAGEVTGSCFHVTAGDARFLVDCGMFQGGDADAKNAAALRFDAGAPDFVVVTHAHIDHSGLLPLLAARGFRGPVYATPATIDLLGVMLPDSAHIQEKDAERRRRATRRGERDDGDVRDAARSTRSRRGAGVAAASAAAVRPRIRAGARASGSRFRDAGHILGSAIVETDGRARRPTRSSSCSPATSASPVGR